MEMAMHSAWGNAHQQRLQYSQQIGLGGLAGNILGMFSGGTSQSAENMMGFGMSRAGAMMGPVTSGLMGMVGLDPMSLGLRAATSAWGGGAGVMGAGMAGMGVMGGAGIAMMGAQYAGQQMYTGAVQQQALNNTLRNSFHFMNTRSATGQGFSGADMRSIGGSLREMSHQFGPAGEVVGMEELTRLAGNMGKMGFAQNISNVKEFKDKFKQMMDTLKVVAKDMSTTLEGAQEFVTSMRGSGIFRASDQLRASGGIRTTALAGGLATSEVTSMMSIGSQISRSVGGLGNAGAMAGMKTIGDIGLAMKAGALSEEDIYNATGLTGAEGRQAMASTQLAQSAQFLKSGRGRRLLASIASTNGTLDESSVMEYMAGGVGTGRTMEMAHRNLAGVGRANFIRNEGRLRGAALEKFGGMLQAATYKSWLSERGYDPTNMDDKAMLAFQRFSGLGRDEADAAIKQVEALPAMIEQRRIAEYKSNYLQQMDMARSTTGVQGAMRNFDQAKEQINGKLQSVGQRIFNWGTEQLEKYMNDLSGTFVQHMSAEAEKAYDRAIHGRGGFDVWQAGFGTERGGGPSWAMGRSGVAAAFTSRGLLGFAGLGESHQDRYAKAGWNLDPALYARNGDATLDRQLKQIDNAVANARGGALDTEAFGIGRGNRAAVRDFFTYHSGTGGGKELLAQFGRFVAASKDTRLSEGWAAVSEQAGDREGDKWAAQSKFIASVAQGAGFSRGMVADRLSGGGKLDSSFAALAKGSFASEEEKANSYFKAFLGRDIGTYNAGVTADKLSTGEKALGYGLDVVGGAGNVASFVFGGGAVGYYGRKAIGVGNVGDYINGDLIRKKGIRTVEKQKEWEKSMAETLKDDETIAIMKGLGGNEDAQSRALLKIEDKVQDILREGKPEGEALGKLRAYQMLGMSHRAKEYGADITEEQARSIMGKMYADPNNKFGGDLYMELRGEGETRSAKEILLRGMNFIQEAPDAAEKEARLTARSRLRSEGRKLSREAISGGYAEYGSQGLQLTSIAKLRMGGENSLAAQVAQTLLYKSDQMENENAFGASSAQGGIYKTLSTKSVKEIQEAAAAASRGGAYGAASLLYQESSARRSIEKSIAQRGIAKTVGDTLGLDLGEDEETRLKKAFGKGSFEAGDALKEILAGKGVALGDKDSDVRSAINRMTQAKTKEEKAAALRDLSQSGAVQDYQQKKRQEAAEKDPSYQQLQQIAKGTNEMVGSLKAAQGTLSSIDSKTTPGNKEGKPKSSGSRLPWGG